MPGHKRSPVTVQAIGRIEAMEAKSRSKVDMNLWLLGISFTLFTFIVAVNPSLVRDNVYLSLQLTFSVPLLISSTFARIRLGHSGGNGRTVLWDRYGFITFILAYGFMVNVVGILLATLVSVPLSMVFWGLNVVLALLYAVFEIMEGREKVWSRLSKDLVFVVIVAVMGILPVLGAY